MEEHDAAHHLFDVVVETGVGCSVGRDAPWHVSTIGLREVRHNPVIMEMVFVEKLIAERIHREGFPEVGQR